MDTARIVALIIGFTLVSAYGDAQGFVGASRMWDHGTVVRTELVRSAVGFGIGALGYWFAVRYLRELGVEAAEIQTLVWFVVTMIGVGIASRAFASWPLVDQAVGVAVIAGVGWLMVRGTA
jgi:hypothetical protein